jgi:aryl-alcohol dehydrogenase-like predicted oxidoreductase
VEHTRLCTPCTPPPCVYDALSLPYPTLNPWQVRYIGLSNETSYGVSEFVHAAKAAGLPRVQTIQNCYHMLQRSNFETDLAETCRSGVVVLLLWGVVEA